MKLTDYYDALARHDWTHMMSDDHSVYSRGAAEERRLQDLRKLSNEHARLYDEWSNYIWMRGMDGARLPRPERPAE